LATPASLTECIRAGAERFRALERELGVRFEGISLCERVLALRLGGSVAGLDGDARVRLCRAVEEITGCPVQGYLFTETEPAGTIRCAFTLGGPPAP
jgi:hypothetical protein